jgi:hypothetical protein
MIINNFPQTFNHSIIRKVEVVPAVKSLFFFLIKAVCFDFENEQ